MEVCLDVSEDLSPRQRAGKQKRFLKNEHILELAHLVEYYPLIESGDKAVYQGALLYPANGEYWPKPVCHLSAMCLWRDWAQVNDSGEYKVQRFYQFLRGGKQVGPLMYLEEGKGDEGRYHTRYLSTRLNILRADHAAIYQEVAGLIWFRGEEPRSAYTKVYAHRLVYTWVLQEDLAGLEIHHLDGHGLNNDLTNVQPLTPEDHALEHANRFEGVRLCWAPCSENSELATKKNSYPVSAPHGIDQIITHDYVYENPVTSVTLSVSPFPQPVNATSSYRALPRPPPPRKTSL